jgi:hypothetical protein
LRRSRVVLLAAAVSAAALLARADGLGIKGKLDVRTLELAYLPGTKTLKVRAIPAGAAAVEMQTSDAETIDRLLRLAELRTRGSRLAVELDGGEIKAFHVAIGGGFAGLAAE